MYRYASVDLASGEQRRLDFIGAYERSSSAVKSYKRCKMRITTYVRYVLHIV